MKNNKTWAAMAALGISAGLLFWGCGRGDESPGGSDVKGATSLAGTVKADGSSTVFPIAEAVAEEFRNVQPDVRVTVGTSGTGGGFKKFGAGETDISNASRPIKPTEVELCKQNGIEYVELPVAYDGLSIVVNPKNSWASSITVEELKKLWEPAAQGKVMKWSDIRAGWPDQEIHLFGPGVDSGTFDYFTDAICGEEGASRGDYTASEDDNVLVEGVSRDEYALGYFGVAYYEENKDKLKLVPVDDGKAENGEGPIAPTLETVQNGTYQPLSRPLFVYVSTKALDRLEVKSFIEFFLSNATNLVGEVGYIPLPEKAYTLAKERANAKVTGSLFGGKGSQVGVRIDQLLEKEQAKR